MFTKNTIIRALVAFMAALALCFTGAVAASASTNTKVIGTVKIRAKVSASAVASASASAKASGATSSYTYVAAQIRTKAKTTSTCKWTTGYNSVRSGGKVHWYYDGVKSKICKLKKPVKVGKYTVKWVKKGGGTTGKNCGNYFRPKKGPKTKAQILDVKSGHTAKVKTSAKANASAKARVRIALTVWYNGKQYTQVKVVDVANATASGKGSATAKVKVTNKTKLKATGKDIKKAKLEAESKAVTNAKANAIAEAEAIAKAEVDLVIEIPIEGPPDKPKPEPKPVLLGTEIVNDVLVNNYRTITVSGSVPEGHTATLFAAPLNGGTITANKTQTVSGSFTTTVQYLAPSEVPSASGDIAAGRDTVRFTLTMDNGQSASITTNQFVILARAVTPLTVMQ